MPQPNSFLSRFASPHPVIAMAHVPPLPGTPLHNEGKGMQGLLDAVARDLESLLVDGVDAVMFCNEGDRPYVLSAGPEGVAAMTRVVSQLAPTDRPFGVDYLWDPLAALAIAHATGASFMREVTTGVYESDMGLWAPDAATLLRERRRIGAGNIAILMNVTPEFASPIGSRSVAQAARSAVVSSLADGILVSGPMAGAEPRVETLKEAREAIGSAVPLFINTGAKSTNIAQFLTHADGVIVGSDLKVDGGTWNPVDPERVRRFLAAVSAE
jgi:membrane complex biogenesis BtpA family protein